MAARQPTVEREVKLAVWPGFEIPALDGKLGGTVAQAPELQRLEAVYFDTSDLRLLRRGVTLCFRRSQAPPQVWTAKLPEEAPSANLAGREISLPGRATAMPPMLHDLVRGWAFGAPLLPVARLRTVRSRTTLRGIDGGPVATLDDDEVSIVQRSRVAARFRELEVELADGAPAKLLSRLARRMRSAGAQPVEQVPKFVRALGPGALEPWDLAEPQRARQPSAAEVVTAGLVASAARFVDHIAAVVLDEDPEGVHQARVGMRRLRSDLRTASSLLDARIVEPLRLELDWLMKEFGEVRDLDVLLAGLRSAVGSLDPRDRQGADAVLVQASQDRAEAYERLRATLRTPRCAALLEATTRVAKAPPFTRRAAKRPAAQILPRLVRGPLRDLRRERRKQGDLPDDEGLHRLRIRVKRVRYAAEMAAPVAGKKARRASREMANVQDLLGEHHDAITAVARLRALGARTDPSGAWAAGELGGLQLAHAAACRQRFDSVWKAAARRKRWRWVN